MANSQKLIPHSFVPQSFLLHSLVLLTVIRRPLWRTITVKVSNFCFDFLSLKSLFLKLISKVIVVSFKKSNVIV